MIVFENDGEIDPRLVMLIGVNVKETESPIGFFGTGLKYAVACLLRWGEEIRIQSGVNEFTFRSTPTEIRGKSFGIISMFSRYDRAELGFTTDLGKRWEPWMVYRELWCNAHDEPSPRVYDVDVAPRPSVGTTRVVVGGTQIEDAHGSRSQFILDIDRSPICSTGAVDIYAGPAKRIFYRGIAVRNLGKPALYTFNIKEALALTEDRTANAWWTDVLIARALTHIDCVSVIDETLLAPPAVYESTIDYDYAADPKAPWQIRAAAIVADRPLDVPTSVRRKFETDVKTCPTCGRPM